MLVIYKSLIVVSAVILVTGVLVSKSCYAQTIGYSLRFYGNGVNDIDRVKIRIDSIEVAENENWPVDVGSDDFTIEFWMKADPAENTAKSIDVEANERWVTGNIVLDRNRFNQDREFGISIAGSTFVFGIRNNGNSTIGSTTIVLDNDWHHIAVQRQRSDGRMDLYIDGNLEGQEIGPSGDISYPDDGVPCSTCCDGGPCTNSDPFLVIGAEKHDAGLLFPSYSGFIDELRISNTLRYSGNSFDVPIQPFTRDGNTMGLYHFDEGIGDVIADSSGAVGGPSDGMRKFGGSPPGPEWSTDTPFNNPVPVTVGLFTGKVTARGHVVLEWTTFSELNNYGYEVQRRGNARGPFVTLPNSFIPGHGTINTPMSYSFVDSTVTPGSWWYRLKQIDLDGTVEVHREIRVDVTVQQAPRTFRFEQNYPNPFNPETTIRFAVPNAGRVVINIYSVLGRELVTLVDEYKAPGFYVVEWNGRDRQGRKVPSGVYLYKMKAKDFAQIHKMILLR